MSKKQLDPSLVYGFYKRGNKETSHLKASNIGMKNSMLIDYCDPTDSGWKAAVMLDEFMEAGFGCIKYPRSYKSNLIEGVKGIYTSGIERERSVYVDETELETLLGIPNLASDWKNGVRIPLIDGTALGTSHFKDASKKEWKDPIADLRAISSGSHNYGSGETYLTKAILYADLANLIAALQAHMTSAISITATATMTENLAGFTFTDTNDLYHSGVFGTGNVSSIDAALTFFINMSPEGAGNVILEKHDILLTIAQAVNARIFAFEAGVATGFTVDIRKNIVDGAELGSGLRGVFMNDADVVLNFYRNKFRGIKGINVWCLALDLASKLENNTLEINAVGGTGLNLGSKAILAQNNLLFDTGGNACFTATTAATGKNNVTNDLTGEDSDFATGSGNVSSVTPLDEVLSLTKTDSTYLEVKAGGSAEDGAISPSIPGNTDSIEERAVPGPSGKKSVGASQIFEAAIGGVGLLAVNRT